MAQLPRADMANGQVRVWAGVAVAGFWSHRPQKYRVAVTRWIGQRIRKPTLPLRTGEDPSRWDESRLHIAIEEAKPLSSSGEGGSEAVRRRPAEVFPGRRNQAGVNEQGLQRSAGRKDPFVQAWATEDDTAPIAAPGASRGR